MNLKHARSILDEFYGDGGLADFNKKFVLELLKRIETEGLDSGYKLFEDAFKLIDTILKQLPLKPISNDNWDYCLSETFAVHRECPLVHKEGDKYYQIKAICFELPNGRRVWSAKSTHYFDTFPYMPFFKVIKVDSFSDIDNFEGLQSDN